MFIKPVEVENILKTLSVNGKTAVVGISGGADSLYLTLLLQEWMMEQGGHLIAVTVDHKLRPESSKEAKTVHHFLKNRGIEHVILTWEGQKPQSRIEERAREKRYELLLDFCHSKGADYLFLAHHRLDEVETFWARLSRGSGLDGLTAMHPVSSRAGVLVIRPLLDMDKAEIVKALQEQGVNWIEDPMNQDVSYERVRWRQNQIQLDKMGLVPEKICLSVKRLQRVQKALDFYVDDFMLQAVQYMPEGYVVLNKNSFENQPEEIQIRVLLRLLQLLRSNEKMISLESVEKIIKQLPQHATLSGCQWVISREQIFLGRELKHMPTERTIKAFQWNEFGPVCLWTNTTFKGHCAVPEKKKKDVPHLIQRSFLAVPAGFTVLTKGEINAHYQKELEKKLEEDYKNKAPIVVMGFNKLKEDK